MDVLMPQLGETVDEGRILRWYKSVGDAVRPGDNLFEIETDKVTMEVPSTVSGVLSKILVGQDEAAAVGTVVAVVAEDGEQWKPEQAEPRVAASDSPAQRSAPARRLDPFQEVASPVRNFGTVRVPGIETTPLSRRLAAEAGIDLSAVSGSGPGGRIVARDLATRLAAAGGLKGDDQRGAQIKGLFDRHTYTELAVDGMRKAIARRLTESKQTIPHFYLTADIEVDALLQLRQQLNSGKQASPTEKISINDLIIKAWATSLQRVPEGNVVWAEEHILRFTRVDIGVAVSVDGGLMTPVVRDAGTKSVREISANMKDLAARARVRKLLPQEMQGGSSALSNLGNHGVREFAAIVNPPHSTILAVGSVERRATEAADGSVRFVSMMTATLSCDHRVVDGVLGARLLGALRDAIDRLAALAA